MSTSFALPTTSVQAPIASNSTRKGRKGASTLQVDTITLRAPVSGYDRANGLVREAPGPGGEIVNTAVSNAWVLPGVDARLTVDHRNGAGRPFARIETSLPRVVFGSNIQTVDLYQAFDAVVRLHRLSGQFVSWTGGPEDLTVNRLDLVYDIKGATDPSHLLNALAQVPGQRAGAARRYADPAHSGAQTLVRGSSTRWMAYLYDKHQEVLSHRRAIQNAHGRTHADRMVEASRGVLRCEVRLRRDILRGAGMNTVGDLDPDVLRHLSRHYTRRAGFEDTVGGVGDLREWCHRKLSGPNAKHVRTALAQTLMDALGVSGGATGRSVRKYRRNATDMGLTREMLGMTPIPGQRIDFDSRQVVEVRDR
jgi:hypothetical protein